MKEKMVFIAVNSHKHGHDTYLFRGPSDYYMNPLDDEKLAEKLKIPFEADRGEEIETFGPVSFEQIPDITM